METGLIAIGAALAVGLAGLATGYAQARIGAAAMGLIAERPEMATPTSAREVLIEPSLEHRVLVDALRSRRPATASKAARAHITRALDRLHDEDQR